MKQKTFFNSPKSLEDLKKQYRELSKKHHPDVGGNAYDMKDINAEYEKLFDLIKKGFTPQEEKKNKHTTDDGFREVINKIINLPDIEIEILGCWVWVSGLTHIVANELRNSGFRFSALKKTWYWHKPIDTKYFYRDKRTMNEIRKMYGSEKVDKSNQSKLSA